MSIAENVHPAGFYTLGAPITDEKVPAGPLEERWDTRKFNAKLINPTNRRKISIIIVGTGLAGASAAATLGEAGYKVTSFCYQDSPRRAHSIAAQGGINAAKNYQHDGDSVYRLFYETVKGGDYRAREANVYRLAQVSVNIIDQCVAQGVPFAREYGGLLDTRSFGGVQVSRTFYARGQTGQQLLIGAYQALERQIAADLAPKLAEDGLVFVGLDEAALLWGTVTVDDIRALLPQPSTVIVKDGEVGATSLSATGTVFEPSPKIDVVEVVGAGDAFAAGYLHALLAGRSERERLQRGHEAAGRALTTTDDVGAALA